MTEAQSLIREVSLARQDFINAAKGLSFEQACFKPGPDSWSVIDNVEHMYWAEIGGICGMWKMLEAVQQHKPLFSGEAVHAGLPIETIIEKTWRDKEDVPETAKPRWGGSLAFWINALQSCQPLLEDLGQAIGDTDPETVIHPHPISGPMNMIQRFAFLRFHLQRHTAQVERIKSDPGFPKNA